MARSVQKGFEPVSAAHPAAIRGPSAFAARSAGRLVGAAGLLLFAVATGVALSKHPLPLTLVLAFGLGLLGTLALVLARYDVAVGLGIFLLAAVRIEPAPADLILFVVIAVAFVTGRFYIRRVPLIVTVLLSVFLALNMLASVELIDVGRAVTFFAITLYLVIFALWLTGYVQSPTTARVVLQAYIVAAVLSAGLAVLALFVAFPGHNLLVFGPRAKGLFKDPNVLGPFLIPPALMLLEETVSPRLLRARLHDEAGGALDPDDRDPVRLFTRRLAELRHRRVRDVRRVVPAARRRTPSAELRRGRHLRRIGAVRCTCAHVVLHVPERASPLAGVRHATVRGPGARASSWPSGTHSESGRASSRRSRRSPRTAPTSARSPKRASSACSSCSRCCS